MALIALASAKGSPGVTTTALALTLTWSSPVVIAECDPSGGSVLPGFLRGQLGSDRGLMPLAAAELRSERLAVDFWRHLVDFDPPGQQRLLLPGISEPAQAGSLAPIWGRLATFFSGLEIRHRYDVLADCGRLTTVHPPTAILHSADAVLLVIRPELPSISAAAAALRTLRATLTEHGSGTDGLGLVLVGEGTYSGAEIGKQLGVPVVAEMPTDERSARALTLGGTVRHAWPLLKRATQVEPRLRELISRRRRPRALPAEQEVSR
ncbi:MAG TPA: ParA family protein, partial [Micromonosporaceae bacterium]